MRLVICGGRVGVEDDGAWAVLDKLRKIGWITDDDEIAEGNAHGYDRIAGAWGRKHRLTCHKFKIDAALDGDRDDAPKRRNQRMFDVFRPTHALGFPGGPGTRDMLTICSRANISVADVEFDPRNRRFQVWSWPNKGTGQPAMLITEGRY